MSDLHSPPERSLRVMAGTELTIYIVEDSPAVMERLLEALGDIPNAKVVGSADEVAAAMEGMRREQPRVLILDIQLRGGSGFQVLKQLRSSASRPEAVIVVTNYPSDDYRIASRECGADHFFDKASEFHKVREVLLQIDAA